MTARRLMLGLALAGAAVALLTLAFARVRRETAEPVASLPQAQGPGVPAAVPDRPTIAPTIQRRGRVVVQIFASRPMARGISGKVVALDDNGAREAEENFGYSWDARRPAPPPRRVEFTLAPGAKHIVVAFEHSRVLTFSAVLADEWFIPIDVADVPRSVATECRVVDPEGYAVHEFEIEYETRTDPVAAPLPAEAVVAEWASNIGVSLPAQGLSSRDSRLRLHADGRLVHEVKITDTDGGFAIFTPPGWSEVDVAVHSGRCRTHARVRVGEETTIILPIPPPTTGTAPDERRHFVLDILFVELADHRADIREDLLAWLDAVQEDGAYAPLHTALARFEESLPARLDYLAWLADAQDRLVGVRWFDTTPLEDKLSVFRVELKLILDCLDALDRGDDAALEWPLGRLMSWCPTSEKVQRELDETRRRWADLYGLDR